MKVPFLLAAIFGISKIYARRQIHTILSHLNIDLTFLGGELPLSFLAR